MFESALRISVRSNAVIVPHVMQLCCRSGNRASGSDFGRTATGKTPKSSLRPPFGVPIQTATLTTRGGGMPSFLMLGSEVVFDNSALVSRLCSAQTRRLEGKPSQQCGPTFRFHIKFEVALGTSGSTTSVEVKSTPPGGQMRASILLYVTQ